jgi:hypothetical protein
VSFPPDENDPKYLHVKFGRPPAAPFKIECKKCGELVVVVP